MGKWLEKIIILFLLNLCIFGFLITIMLEKP